MSDSDREFWTAYEAMAKVANEVAAQQQTWPRRCHRALARVKQESWIVMAGILILVAVQLYFGR
jgi:hypothetical protein